MLLNEEIRLHFITVDDILLTIVCVRVGVYVQKHIAYITLLREERGWKKYICQIFPIILDIVL